MNTGRGNSIGVRYNAPYDKSPCGENDRRISITASIRPDDNSGSGQAAFALSLTMAETTGLISEFQKALSEAEKPCPTCGRKESP